MSIEVSRLYFLFLIPIVFLFIYFTFKHFRGAIRKDYFVIISRIVVLLLLVIAISDATIVFRGKNTATVFLLDLSESMGDFKEEGTIFIDNALKGMPKDNTAGVIVFGDNSEVDKIVDKKNKYRGIKEAPVTTATNIEEAINSSMGLFPKGAAKRIVLISDGEENQGEVLNTIPLLKEQNIDFKTYKVEKALGNEVYVDDVKVPDNIAVGEEFSIVVKVESNFQTNCNLVLFSGRERRGEQKVQLQKGTNTFVFKDVQSSGGFKGYRVLIEAENDTNMANNEVSCYTNVTSKPKILVIEGKPGDGLGVIEVLKSANSDINVITPKASPNNLNELLEYKSIVLCNVYSDDLNKGFMENIENYVKDYGGGLVTFGGDEAYALGGYKDTALEKVLPVNMEKKGQNEIPQISLTLIIDHSGSMQDTEGSTSKMTLAKEAAMKSIDNLRATDEIAVLAFDDSFQWVVEPQKVDNKDDIKGRIAGVTANGGTSIYPALKEGATRQKSSGAKIKHIILLTDGQDGFGVSEYNGLIEEMRANNITLSTVSVGQDSNNQLLETLAKKGNGRSYHTDIFTDIPRIFAKEVFLSTGEYIINEEFVPKVVGSSEILSGVMVDNKLPTVLGYTGTSMKDKAIEVLRTNRDEPLLATYQYGLGKTASWTSDINGQWSKNYLTWDKGAQFIKNIVYSTIPAYSADGKITVTQKGSEAVVQLYSDNIKDGAKLKGIYNSEAGDSGELELTQLEPGKYEGVVELKDLGFYNFNIREEEDGKVINNYNGAFAMQYSQEFKFNKNKGNIDTLITEVNGSIINKPKEVFEGKVIEATKRIALTIPALILALILFLFDVCYRRLNLDLNKYLKKINIKNILKEKQRKGEKINKEKVEKVSIKEEKVVNNKNIGPELLVQERTEQSRIDSENKGKKVKEKINVKQENKGALDTNLLLKKKQNRNN